MTFMCWFLDSTWRSKVFITTLDFNKVIIPPSYSNRKKKVCQWTNYFRYFDRSAAQPTSTAPPTITTVLLLLSSYVTAPTIAIVVLVPSYITALIIVITDNIFITTSVASFIAITDIAATPP